MRISRIEKTLDQGAHRVQADVEGAPLWFESADVALSPSPEAFASAMLIPAIARGEALTVEDSLSAVWMSNVSQILPVFREWWGYQELAPQPASVKSDDVMRMESTALCFSGGVDSFYALLRSGYTINHLVFVLGFDVALDDRVRFEAFVPSLGAVAAANGAHSVVIRTNLREHPAFAPVSWERTHGGALAAIGHLLSDTDGQLLIAASQTFSQTTPWGSHWRTDRFWSSEKLQIVTVGCEIQRFEKLREIAREPLAHAHLRVCWENRAPSGNCSRCEKCVRTRLVLAECGELDKYSVFDGAASLLEDVNALPHSNGIKLTYRALLKSSRVDRRMKRAIRRLVTRDEKFIRPRQGPEKRRRRLHRVNQWLEQNPLWRKIPWRLRSWINSRIRLNQ
ncbi:MAG: hypothetical protein AB7U82_11840 [Blastocatellales bacterium]